MANIQAQRAQVVKDLPKEKDRIGLTETGVFDSDIYGGKAKFEGYNYSIASQDDDEDDDGIANERPGQRQSYTAPVALLNDVAKSNEDYDPFAEHKKATVASRESEYQARRRNQQISPARVDFFADGVMAALVTLLSRSPVIPGEVALSPVAANPPRPSHQAMWPRP